MRLQQNVFVSLRQYTIYSVAVRWWLKYSVFATDNSYSFLYYTGPYEAIWRECSMKNNVLRCVRTDGKISNYLRHTHPRLSVCPSVRPSIWLCVCSHISARFPPHEFPWHMILGTSIKICLHNPDLVKIGQKYRALHMKTHVYFLATGDITRHKIGLFEWYGIRLLGWPRRYKQYANASQFYLQIVKNVSPVHARKAYGEQKYSYTRS
jgi:hypothetical protein